MKIAYLCLFFLIFSASFAQNEQSETQSNSSSSVPADNTTNATTPIDTNTTVLTESQNNTNTPPIVEPVITQVKNETNTVNQTQTTEQEKANQTIDTIKANLTTEIPKLNESINEIQEVVNETKNVTEEPSGETEIIEFDIYSVFSFSILLGCLILSCMVFNCCTDKEFLFAFIVLIFAVLCRIGYNILEILPLFYELDFAYEIMPMLDVFCQFIFVFHCQKSFFAWPPEHFILTAINAIISGSIYILLYFCTDITRAITLRSALIIQLIICFLLRKRSTEGGNKKVGGLSALTIVAGTAYLVFFTILETIPLLLINVDVDVDFTRVNNVYQGSVLGGTLVLSALLARRTAT